MSEAWSSIRPRRNTPIRRLEAKADLYIQVLSRVVWKGHCCWCKKYVRTARQGGGHHLFTKNFFRFRHSIINVPYMCLSCHNKVHSGGDPEFKMYIRQHWYYLYEWYEFHRMPKGMRKTQTLLKERITKLEEQLRKHGVNIKYIKEGDYNGFN